MSVGADLAPDPGKPPDVELVLLLNVAGFCFLGPSDQRKNAHAFPVGKVGQFARKEAVIPVDAQVIRSAFEHAEPQLLAYHFPDYGYVFRYKLVLEVARVGRNQYA